MPYASSRLDLWVVPADPDAELPGDALSRWRRLGVSAGWFTPQGEPGPRAEGLVAGGFRAVWLHHEPALRFVSNHQGGFRVTCPACAANLVPTFQRVYRGWRDGGPRRLTCPSCGAAHDLPDLAFAPPAAFYRLALQVAEAEDGRVAPEALDALAEALGPVRVVARRVS